MPDDVDLLLELLGWLLEEGMVEGSRCFGATGKRVLVYVAMNTGVVVRDVDPSTYGLGGRVYTEKPCCRGGSLHIDGIT